MPRFNWELNSCIHFYYVITGCVCVGPTDRKTDGPYKGTETYPPEPYESSHLSPQRRGHRSPGTGNILYQDKSNVFTLDTSV